QQFAPAFHLSLGTGDAQVDLLGGELVDVTLPVDFGDQVNGARHAITDRRARIGGRLALLRGKHVVATSTAEPRTADAEREVAVAGGPGKHPQVHVGLDRHRLAVAEYRLEVPAGD